MEWGQEVLEASKSQPQLLCHCSDTESQFCLKKEQKGDDSSFSFLCVLQKWGEEN